LKIRATIQKELLLLIRDPGGLALIFLMPMALVMVMALVQDAPFRDYQESSIEVLFADEDGDSLGQKIEDAFSESPNIHLVIQHDISVINNLVGSGKYKAAIQVFVEYPNSQIFLNKNCAKSTVRSRVIAKFLRNVDCSAS